MRRPAFIFREGAFALPALAPGANEIEPPRRLCREVAGDGQQGREHDKTDDQRLSEPVGPRRHGMHPADGVAHVVFRWWCKSDMPPKHELTDTDRNDVERNDRERIGVIQRSDQRQRQVDPEDQAAEGGAEHLERAGDQSAEKACCHGARRRVAVEVPEPWVQQRIGERRQPAVAMYRLMIRKKASELFAHDVSGF